MQLLARRTEIGPRRSRRGRDTEARTGAKLNQTRRRQRRSAGPGLAPGWLRDAPERQHALGGTRVPQLAGSKVAAADAGPARGPTSGRDLRGLNNHRVFLPSGRGRVSNPWPLSRKGGVSQARSRDRRPRNLREAARGRGRPLPRVTHRRSAGRSTGPAPTGPSWRAAGESHVPFDRRSRLRPPTSGSDPHTSSRAVRPLHPKQVWPLFTPTYRGRGTGNTNQPIAPHHAPSVPNGNARGGPQSTNRSCPGAVAAARSVAPLDWSHVAVFVQSQGSAGPSHGRPPLCLGSLGP